MRSIQFALVAVLLIVAVNTQPIDKEQGIHPTRDRTFLDQVCKGMAPSHDQTVAGASSAPYTVDVAQTTLQSGERLIVTLNGDPLGTQFRGFMVQARVPGTTTPIGIFVVTADDAVVKTIDCVHENSRNTIFQKQSRTDKTEVNFVWEAPADFVGEVEFDATVVKTFAEYWVGIKSAKVTVSAK